MFFLTTKVPKKSVKRGIFSVRGTSMVTIKQRESDALDGNPDHLLPCIIAIYICMNVYMPVKGIWYPD